MSNNPARISDTAVISFDIMTDDRGEFDISDTKKLDRVLNSAALQFRLHELNTISYISVATANPFNAVDRDGNPVCAPYRVFFGGYLLLLFNPYAYNL